MVNKKNFILEIYKKNVNDSFVNLWLVIAESFKLNKIPNNNLDNNSDNIIYKNNDYYITINNKWNYGRTLVVKDKNQQNRYFIGFEFGFYSSTSYICGMIIYFDNYGKISKKKILNQIVCHYYDLYIDESNSILYNQTLLFYSVNHYPSTLVLFVNLLDYEDCLITSYAKYTEIKTNNFINKENINNNHRFLDINIINSDKNYSNIFIDLGSLKLVKSNEYLILDYYEINSSDNIDNFINESKKFEQEEYSDGYPTLCPKCGELTKKSTYKYKRTLMSLGNSFCDICKIRFSQSKNNWICCKFIKDIEYNNNNKNPDIYLCNLQIDSSNNFKCKNEIHSDISLKTILSEETFKFPFKKKIEVTIKDY